MERKLSRIDETTPQQGFLGPGHTMRHVVQGAFSQTDPFIALADDTMAIPDGKPVGGPHPHAGFETVTLMLRGKWEESSHVIQAGDFQMMTAGSGVIHTETIAPNTSLHLLQLWLTLPKNDRWTQPRVQNLSFDHVPKRIENGVDIRVYSGSFAGLTSPIKNYVPVIIALVQLEKEVTTIQQLPASFNTFLYVIDGSVEVGDEKKRLAQRQVGWLDKGTDASESELRLTAGESGCQLVIYAGQQQHVDIVSKGPFIGDSQEDMVRLYKEYHQGKMKHIATLPDSQLVNY